MDWKDVKTDLLKDPETRKAYERFDFTYWLSKKWIDFKIWWKS
jgi:hypothetical protein